MSFVMEMSQLHSALPTKCLTIHGKKVNRVLMYVLPLMLAILSSTYRLIYFVRFCVWKCSDFSSTLYSCQDMCNSSLSFKAGHSVLWICPEFWWQN